MMVNGVISGKKVSKTLKFEVKVSSAIPLQQRVDMHAISGPGGQGGGMQDL